MIDTPARSAITLFFSATLVLSCAAEPASSAGQAGQSGNSDVKQSRGGTATGSGGTGTLDAQTSSSVVANSSLGGKSSTGGTASIGGKPMTGGTASIGGKPMTGGTASIGGKPMTGGTASIGGKSSTGASAMTGGVVSSSDSGAGVGGSSIAKPSTSVCDTPSLVWKSANKTNYTSYPDPNSEECIVYNGCEWAGQFAACDGTKTEQWVSSHNIVAAFPDFDTLELHDLCLRKGNKTIVVTVLDTCGDSDCSGCCTKNKGTADQLIDIESYTNERWGVSDGPIEWADLGPTSTSACN